jgi:hypothetical protein
VLKNVNKWPSKKQFADPDQYPFQDPDPFPGCLGSRSGSYSNGTTKLSGREKLTKKYLLDIMTRIVKMYKKKCFRLVHFLFQTARIRIHIKFRSRIRICIKVKSRIRTRIKKGSGSATLLRR